MTQPIGKLTLVSTTKMMRFRALLLLLTLAACTPRQIPTPKAQGACPSSSTALALATSTNTATPNEPPTFDTVKEIFSANSGVRKYKCSVCHANFLNYNTASDPFIFNKIIASIENKTMPREGELVQDADLQTLKAWQAAGFPEKKEEAEQPDESTNHDQQSITPSPTISDSCKCLRLNTEC